MERIQCDMANVFQHPNQLQGTVSEGFGTSTGSAGQESHIADSTICSSSASALEALAFTASQHQESTGGHADAPDKVNPVCGLTLPRVAGQPLLDRYPIRLCRIYSAEISLRQRSLQILPGLDTAGVFIAGGLRHRFNSISS
ncbi:hypothetical protein N7539_007887 [Penicillium diatomitis]|uniref:Uncharacterized protein n=1 Tax=Penicillium diatomitis TaxID=2819901 RepID=A0A9X0BND8_9EURO|nr:uncharacterized protein N7539_007887 [Penicillium diatomitis]KAJ5475600.1 hypothetical protein N7539_007887 [Penicillium diatomitis]